MFSSVSPQVPHFVPWDAPFALHALAGGPRPVRETFWGLQAGGATNRDAACSHHLLVASAVNKMNWAG